MTAVATADKSQDAEVPSEQWTRRDPKSLTTLPEIMSCLSSFQSEEAELSDSLTKLLSTREPIVDSLARLQSLVPQLDELHLEATMLSRKVSSTAQTAQRVGGRVSSLDEEMQRIRDAGERVSQVMELKVMVTSSMDSQDWESATRHCARAMAIPVEVTSGAFAEIAVPTSTSHLPPDQTLQAMRQQLLTIFRTHFEQASRTRDAAATSRFFKLFPAIGWEAEGLQAYASFVVDLVGVRTPPSVKTSSPLYFITSVTALFESIAMIVDQHQPVVEKYYGQGKMSSVIERLLEECDRIVKDVIEAWEEERSMKRKLLDISSSGTSIHTPMLNRKQASQFNVPDGDLIDPREIDKVLSELAGITGRWSLLRKFLSDSLKDDASDSGQEPHGTDAPAAGLKASDLKASSELHVSVPGVDSIEATLSHKLFEDLLTTYYIPLEVWYTRTIIEKAHQLSNPDISQYPPTTSAPDDIFYVLKIILSRLISTGSLKVVERTIELLRDIIDHDYAGVMKRKLDDAYRAGSASSNVRADKGERESRLASIILLNDLDTSSSHMERLTRDLLSYPVISQQFLEVEHKAVKAAVSSLSVLVPRIRTVLRTGVEQLFNQLMRPKLRTLVSDMYKDVSYVLDDDSYASAEYRDTVRKRFVRAWESLVDEYKDSFTEDNYRLFFGLALDVLLRPWEKFVMGFKYTELGAIRFDRDLRSIMAYLSAQMAFSDAREKFLRLQQISTLLNLDSEEDVDEFYNGSGIAWKLSPQEARSIAQLRNTYN